MVRRAAVAAVDTPHRAMQVVRAVLLVTVAQAVTELLVVRAVRAVRVIQVV